MALIVYDGTNAETAEAVVSVSEYDTFHTDYYGSAASGTTAEKEAAIRRVNAFLHALPWRGVPAEGYEQSIPFPRKGVTDANGFEILDTLVPGDVKKAAHMLARTEQATVGALSPVGAITDTRKRVKIDTLEVEYHIPDMPMADASKQVVSDAMNLLRKYLRVGTLEKMGLAEYTQKWGITAV